MITVFSRLVALRFRAARLRLYTTWLQFQLVGLRLASCPAATAVLACSATVDHMMARWAAGRSARLGAITASAWLIFQAIDGVSPHPTLMLLGDLVTSIILITYVFYA